MGRGGLADQTRSRRAATSTDDRARRCWRVSISRRRVRRVRRRVFQWFTVLLLGLCVWTAYANVFSDDADVRVKARTALHKAAPCGEDCKLEGLRGERGM